MEKILRNAILSNIQKEIKNNKEEIKKLNRIDIKYCNIEVETENLLKIKSIIKK